MSSDDWVDYVTSCVVVICIIALFMCVILGCTAPQPLPPFCRTGVITLRQPGPRCNDCRAGIRHFPEGGRCLCRGRIWLPMEEPND